MSDYPSSLIPRNKSDISSIDELMKLSDEEIQPIIPSLLEWLQDINWPVAPHIAKVLLRHQFISEMYIAEILKPEQTDAIWKFWLIRELVYKWHYPFTDNIKHEILRIVSSPTDEERAEEVDTTAAECVKIHKL